MGADTAKPLRIDEFKSLCIQARNATREREETPLLQSLCLVMIKDLGDPELICPPASADSTALMDAILCDYLVHRYNRENSFDPFPIIQHHLLAEQ